MSKIAAAIVAATMLMAGPAAAGAICATYKGVTVCWHYVH